MNEHTDMRVAEGNILFDLCEGEPDAAARHEWAAHLASLVSDDWLAIADGMELGAVAEVLAKER